MSSFPRDPYKVLGVDKSADLTAIKTAYRKLVLRCHPDKVQDPALKAVKQDEFQRVQQAYEILSDETKRDEYDEDAKLKKMRDEVSQKLRENVLRNMARTSASPHPSPKAYNEPGMRTSEPAASFKPAPPPTSPFSPYRSGDIHFSHSWDRDIPLRTKPAAYEEEHRARRTSSHEKPRDEYKEERRRRKDDEQYDWLREKDRERERARDRDRDRDKRSRVDRERDDKKEKSKRDMEKREKDRDRNRRQDRVSKPVYSEPYYDSEDDHHAGKKKTPTNGNGGSTPGKKFSSSPRRDKTSRRDESPRVQSTADKTSTDKMSDNIKIAAEYMTKRRGAKSSPIPSHLPENVAYSPNFADPEDWHAPTDMPRSRRPSHDDKKYRTRAEAMDPEVEEFVGRPTEFRPPPLTKSHTLPAGAMHMSSSSVPRPPGLSRSATTDYGREHFPPVVPAPPPAEPGRHSSKSERRRKGSFEVYEDNLHPRRSPGQPRVLQHVYDDVPPLLRTVSSGHYRSPGEVYYHSVSMETPRRAGFEKIKVAPTISPDKVYYQTKRFSDDDIAYSSVKHSSGQYPSPQSYMHVRS